MIKEEISSMIDELDINKNLKKELNYLNKKIQEVLNKEKGLKIDIIIDNMSQKDINILLEFTIKIIKKYRLFDDFINFDDLSGKYSKYSRKIIVINDFSSFFDEILDRWNKERAIKKFFQAMKDNENLVILTCPDKIEKYFNDVDNIYFDKDIFIHLTENKGKKEKYNELLKKYQEKNIKYELTYKDFKEVYEYLNRKYYMKQIDIVNYMFEYSLKKHILEEKEINKKIFEKFTESKKENKKIENLVGLNNIKEQMNSLYKYLIYCKNLEINENIYLNMFFLGNPGTGKTTVARLYVDKLYELGYIKEKKLIEIVPNDLTGKYIGETKEKVRKILNNSKNGILFIDEAYLLYTNNYSSGNNPYMEEAIVELIKYLENPSNIVIFAGYPKEMRKLYNANPGIKSRIYSEIIFEDYNEDELYKILKQDLLKKGLSLNKVSKNKIIRHINELKKEKNFGNARTMKQLAQKMIMNHAKKGKNNKILDHTDLPTIETVNDKMGFDIYDRK